MMRPRPHQMTRQEWIKEHKIMPSLPSLVSNSGLFEDHTEEDWKTVVLDDVLHKVDNPVLYIQNASRVATDRILIVVPDSKRSEEQDEESKRTYTGRMLFDQCIKAGLTEEQVKIDHLNEMPNSYWLATINL